MFVYALTEPIDLFDGLTPLPEWIAEEPTPRTRWVLQAILALDDAAAAVRWSGEMRHLPSVGVALDPPGTNPYLVVKQNNNGTTFVISSAELALPADEIERRAQTPNRSIGAWTHPTSADIIEAEAESKDSNSGTAPCIAMAAEDHAGPY